MTRDSRDRVTAREPTTRPIPVRDLLDAGLRVSVGCTEPGVIALASAHAARVTLAEAHPDLSVIETITVGLRRGIYKNALAAAIPNTGGRCGAALAAALGAGCNPDDGLRLLTAVTPAGLANSLALVDAGVVTTTLLQESNADALARVDVRARGHRGCAVIGGAHDRLVRLERDDAALALPPSPDDEAPELHEPVTIADLVRAIDAAPLADLARIDEGLRLNRAAMAAGFELKSAGVGAAIRRSTPCTSGRVAAAAAAACDARMNGIALPIMTSCGSGNQGVLVHLPIATLAEIEQIDDARTLRAIALAHLVCRYATDRIGLVAPLCGLFVKAGLGVAAGFCYLLSGDAIAVDRAVRFMAAGHAGTVCDGASPSCAIKMAAASEAALRSARMAIDGMPMTGGPGIASTSAESAVSAIAALAASMDDADRELFARLRAEAEGANAPT